MNKTRIQASSVALVTFCSLLLRSKVVYFPSEFSNKTCATKGEYMPVPTVSEKEKHNFSLTWFLSQEWERKKEKYKGNSQASWRIYRHSLKHRENTQGTWKKYEVSKTDCSLCQSFYSLTSQTAESQTQGEVGWNHLNHRWVNRRQKPYLLSMWSGFKEEPKLSKQVW